MVVPWISSEVSTTTKVISNNQRAPSTPPSSGNTASTMGTAPRSPVQAIKLFSRMSKSNGTRHSATATGRATRIRNRAMTTAMPRLLVSSVGVTSSPSNRNMADCASQAMASMARSTLSLAPPRWLPATSPQR